MMEQRYPGVVIFVAGFATMAFELAGSRVLGPYFGTSVFVWTSLIGIVFASLSLGYWLGGRLSILKTDQFVLALILSVSAFFILVTAHGNMYILDRVLKYIPGLQLRAVVGTVVLFSPASIGFGMILPYAIKIRIQSVKSSGKTIGNLYAVSSIGSILGTFAAGFFLVPQFGHANVLYGLALMILILAMFSYMVRSNLVSLALTASIMAALVVFWIRNNSKEKNYIDADTQYNRVLIFESEDWNTGRPIKMLKVNDENSSAMFIDKDDDLVFEYLKYYRLIEHFVPGFKRSLMVGGSGYAFPKDYLRRYPDARLDVVEIDPGLTSLARRHFRLKDHPNLKIIHEDGRTFLDRNEKVYDAILMDAYKSLLTVPFQLTTREAVQSIYNSLSPDGVVLANIISSLNPSNNQFPMAELATYQSVFPQVYLFAVQYPNPTEQEKEYFQNFMLVGLKSAENPEFMSTDSLLNEYLQHRYSFDLPSNTQVLTDEYAPVEFLSSKAIK